jgi:DNA-binding transcriptional MerR regulator
MPAEVDYSPTEASRQLNVADSTLRKYASIYESVFDPLPHSAEGRRYTDTALQRLRLAIQLQREGRAHSIAAALVMLKTGEVTSLQEIAPPSAVGVEALLLEILKRLEAIEQRQLEPPKAEGLEQVQAQLQELAEAKAELERRNKYLMAELEQRDEEVKPRQSWWLWGRKG